MPVKGDTIHSLSQKGKLSKGSNGKKIRVVINYGRPKGHLDVDNMHLTEQEKSGEVLDEPFEERKIQEISPVQSEEVSQERSEEQRNQKTSPMVTSEQVLEESNKEQKDEELSPMVTEKVLDEIIEKQKDEEISPETSDKGMVESIEKQKDKETSPGSSGAALEENSGELKPVKVVAPKGQTDASLEKEGSNQDNKNRGVAVEDDETSEDNGGANYNTNFDGTDKLPDYEDGMYITDLSSNESFPVSRLQHFDVL